MGLTDLIEQTLQLLELVVMTEPELTRPVALAEMPQLTLQRDDGAGELARHIERRGKHDCNGDEKEEKERYLQHLFFMAHHLNHLRRHSQLVAHEQVVV